MVGSLLAGMLCNADAHCWQSACQNEVHSGDGHVSTVGVNKVSMQMLGKEVSSTYPEAELLPC